MIKLEVFIMEKPKVTMKDIDVDFIYDWVGYIESHMMHEYKRMGVEGLREKYIKNIEEFKKDWTHDEFCFLLCILEYLVQDWQYPEECMREKYVMNHDALEEYILASVEGIELSNTWSQRCVNNALVCCIRHGFLWNRFDEAV